MSEENVQAGAEQAPEVNINDERAIRRARRQAMIDDGIDPYPPTAMSTPMPPTSSPSMRASRPARTRRTS